MAAAAQISSPLCCYCSSFRDIRVFGAVRTVSVARKLGTAFASGSPLSIQKPLYQKSTTFNLKSFSIRCEQSTEESGTGLDVWVGRLAMAGFAAAISVEIVTGKGLLENFGFITPLPAVALVATALVGSFAAFFIFLSVSKK